MHSAIALLLVSTMLVPWSTQASADHRDAVCHYDFEHASRGVPSDWYPTYTDWVSDTSEYVIFGWDPDVSHTGTHSISIELAKNFPRSEISYDTINYNWLLNPTLESDTIYRISFWWTAREVGTHGWVHIRGDDTNGGQRPDYVAPQRPKIGVTDDLVYDGRGWHQYAIDVQTPKRMKYFEVRLGLSMPQGIGHKIWFDDFEITISPRERERRKAGSN